MKAQIHAGGRGKGTFNNGFKGGVHFAKRAEEARDVAAKMLGQTLVTHQTGPAGESSTKSSSRSRPISRARFILRSCSIARPRRR